MRAVSNFGEKIESGRNALVFLSRCVPQSLVRACVSRSLVCPWSKLGPACSLRSTGP